MCAFAGTPVQNNVQELFGLLNLLDRVAFPSMEEFVEQFGGNGAPPTVDQIRALQVCVFYRISMGCGLSHKSRLYIQCTTSAVISIMQPMSEIHRDPSRGNQDGHIFSWIITKHQHREQAPFLVCRTFFCLNHVIALACFIPGHLLTCSRSAQVEVASSVNWKSQNL